MLVPYADGVSNRADWIDDIEILDAETGEPIDLAGASIVLEVRRDWGCSPCLYATTENGKITVTELGRAEFAFTRSEMSAVAPGPYNVGVTITRDGLTDQLIIAVVSILDGIVRK